MSTVDRKAVRRMEQAAIAKDYEALRSLLESANSEEKAIILPIVRNADPWNYPIDILEMLEMKAANVKLVKKAKRLKPQFDKFLAAEDYTNLALVLKSEIPSYSHVLWAFFQPYVDVLQANVEKIDGVRLKKIAGHYLDIPSDIAAQHEAYMLERYNFFEMVKKGEPIAAITMIEESPAWVEGFYIEYAQDNFDEIRDIVAPYPEVMDFVYVDELYEDYVKTSGAKDRTEQLIRGIIDANAARNYEEVAALQAELRELSL